MIKFVPWYDEYISPDCQPTRYALVCFKHYFEAQYMSKFMQVLALSIDNAQYIDRNMFLLLRNDLYILERDLSGTFHTLYFLLTPRFMHFPNLQVNMKCKKSFVRIVLLAKSVKSVKLYV